MDHFSDIYLYVIVLSDPLSKIWNIQVDHGIVVSDFVCGVVEIPYQIMIWGVNIIIEVIYGGITNLGGDQYFFVKLVNCVNKCE